MKKLFVVVFISLETKETFVDSVWENEDDTQKFVTRMNEWERSKDGNGDSWLWIETDYHAK